MTALRYEDRFTEDIARITTHLLKHDVVGIGDRLAAIFEALSILARHPQIGRPVPDSRRELVIGRGPRGYVALYRYDAAIDEVTVHALRAQRERGYGRGSD